MRTGGGIDERMGVALEADLVVSPFAELTVAVLGVPDAIGAGLQGFLDAGNVVPENLDHLPVGLVGVVPVVEVPVEPVLEGQTLPLLIEDDARVCCGLQSELRDARSFIGFVGASRATRITREIEVGVRSVCRQFDGIGAPVEHLVRRGVADQDPVVVQHDVDGEREVRLATLRRNRTRVLLSADVGDRNVHVDQLLRGGRRCLLCVDRSGQAAYGKQERQQGDEGTRDPWHDLTPDRKRWVAVALTEIAATAISAARRVVGTISRCPHPWWINSGRRPSACLLPLGRGCWRSARTGEGRGTRRQRGRAPHPRREGRAPTCLR